jgi:VWFA-related protein
LHPRSIIVLPALFLCAFIALPAQTSSPAADSGVVLKTNARAVAVDVVVTRGQDQPVTALHKEDFQVFEDDKPQSIDFFEEHTVKELPPQALKPLPPMPPGVYTNVPAVAPADDVNVILLDTLNSEGQDLSYGRSQVLEFLRTMKPGTRAAIFLLNDKLNFVQGFTEDNSLLAAAINNKRNQVDPNKSVQFYSRSDAADDAASLATLTAMMGSFATGAGTSGVASMGTAQSKSASFQYARRVAMTLEALSYLARYLGNVPGRKNLLWFAGNFPVNIFPSAQQRESLSDSRIYASQIRKTADLLTTGKVAVYPISIRGMMNDHWMEADGAGSGTASGGAGIMQQIMGDANERADTIFTMNELAADTGEHAFYNTNNLATAANRAIDDGSHYYSIVYTPTNEKFDGKYHRIEIKLAGGHYQLSYRRGYNADDPATLASSGSTSFLSLASTAEKPAAVAISDDPLRPLLMRGLPSASQLLYAVRVVPASPQPAPDAKIAGKNSALTGAVTRYSVDFFIRWTDVTFTPGDPKTQPDTHLGKIQLGLMAYDLSGKAVNWLGATQQMQLDPNVFAAIQNSGVPAHMEIDVPKNTDVFLETGVYDWGSNKAGTLEIPLHPAAGQPAKDSPAATSPATPTQPTPKSN